MVAQTLQSLTCVAGRRKERKSKWAQEGSSCIRSSRASRARRSPFPPPLRTPATQAIQSLIHTFACNFEIYNARGKFGEHERSVRIDRGDSWGPVHTSQEKCEKAALFLRLGLPSTLIRHENALQTGGIWKPPFLRFSVDGKHFENGAFRKLWHHNNHVVFLSGFSSSTNTKWPVIVPFSNFSSVACTENIWCVFKVKRERDFILWGCMTRDSN